MASEGPTNTGSIQGKLGLDIDDWKAKVDLVKAQAEELRSVSPTITVDANTSRAQEQMAAVDAAAAAMGASATTSAAQVDAAAVTVSGAEGRTQTAAEKAAVANEALGAAERDSAKAAVEQAGAEEANSSALTRTGDAAGGAAGRTQLMIAGMVALVSLAGPLTAAAAGIAGGLAGMGAAGVIAIIGVVQQIKAGTAAGQQWSAGLRSLKGDLDGLGNTAANALLSSFERGVTAINQAMPELNSEIGGFAKQLGGAASAALQGVINAFRILNPLFTQGGQVIGQIADGFLRWTQDGGLQKFADYAAQQLPTVVHDLGDVASAVVHVVEAAAPLGGAVLQAIDALANVIGSFPTPVVTVLTAAALAAYVAFKSWSTLGPVFSAVTTKLEGVRGVATAVSALEIGGWALAAAAGVAALNSAVTNTALSMTPLQGEIDRVNQAVSSGDVEKATEDYQKLSNGIDIVRDHMGLWGTTMIGLVSWLHDNKLDWLTFGADSAVTQQLDAVNGYKAAVKSAHEQAAEAAKQAATAEGQLTTALNTQEGAATFLSNAFKLLNGENLDTATAATAQASAFNNAADAVNKNGTAINGNSAAAVANQQAIQQAAQAAQQLATATVTQTGSTDAGTKSFMSSKTALENQLKAQGNLTPAVQKYIDTLFKVPTQLTTKLAVDNRNALAAIAATKSAMDGIQRSINIGISATNLATTGGIKVAFAGGGTVNGPGSRTSDNVAAMLSASEEVTSNDRGQADRWRGLLKMINADAPAAQVAGKAAQIAGVVHAPTPPPAPFVSVAPIIQSPPVQVVITPKVGGVRIQDLIDVRILQNNMEQTLKARRG